jgi:hypothetical protein
VKKPDKEAAKATEATKKDLRKSHFNFGNDHNKHMTTNQERVNNSENHKLLGGGSGIDREAVNAGKEGLRKVNVHYGKEVPNYVTSNKEALVSHDMKQA